jgi:hypothetical protein
MGCGPPKAMKAASYSFTSAFPTKVSSRPKRSEVEGPAVHHPASTNLNGSATLPFVIPSEAEGSAVQGTSRGNVFDTH